MVVPGECTLLMRMWKTFLVVNSFFRSKQGFGPEQGQEPSQAGPLAGLLALCRPKRSCPQEEASCFFC